MSRLLPRRLRQSYAGKLFVSLLLVALAIGVVGGTLYVHTGSMLEQDVRTELRSAAQIEAQVLDEWFDNSRQQTRTIAEAHALQTTADGDAVQYLWDVVERDDDVEAAYLVDTRNGTVVTSVGSSRIASADGVMRPSGQGDFTRRASAGQDVVVSRPFRPYEGSAPVILVSAAVAERPNRSVVTVVNLRQLSNSEAHRLDKARFQVIDDRGVVVMAENGSDILSARFSPDRFSDGGFAVTEYRGEESAVGAATLRTRNWTVTARMPTEQAFALRSAVLEGVVVILGVAVLGLGALGVVLGRSAVRPVRTLARKARALQGGSLDEPIETRRVDAFGDLFRAVDEMRASLKTQIERARRSRRKAQRARAEAERARRESERLSEALERDAERFSEVMGACAQGDLDRRLEPRSESESMEEIAAAFNAMMDDVQAKNEQLEAFTSIVSHDLRNPLTVAHGRAKLLAEETDSEHVASLVDSLERMQAIVDDGLMLARGTAVEDPREVEVGFHARAAWGRVESDGAALSVVDDGTIRADANLLEQAFENLFRNAVEHAGPDVTVTVGVEEWGVFVADDGPGLPAVDDESVFEPGVSDGSGGTGLGLTIVRRIAEAHGWTVTAPQTAAGARFEIMVADAKPETDERERSRAIGGIDKT